MKFLPFFIIFIASLIPYAFAQSPNSLPEGNCIQDTQNPRFSGGIVTSPRGGSNCSSDTGAFVFDDKIHFLPFKIPTYDSLKSIFFDQSKQKDKMLYNSSDLNAAAVSLSENVKVVFVDGNLNFTQNYLYGASDGSKGTIFVVKKDINIDTNVSEINAVLISSGTIYTAGAGCTTNSINTPNQLKINGSLISLDEKKPIQFCRNLQFDNASKPAEEINHQEKYVVILKDLFSETLQKWSEIP